MDSFSIFTIFFVGYRLLSRRDIGVIVENGTAFLFKSALDTARRMRAFLGVGVGNVSLIAFFSCEILPKIYVFLGWIL